MTGGEVPLILLGGCWAARAALSGGTASATAVRQSPRAHPPCQPVMPAPVARACARSGSGRAYRGGIFLSVSAVGRRSMNGTDAGRRTARGTGSCAPSKPTPTAGAGSTGAWSASTRRLAVPTSTRPGPGRRNHVSRKRTTPRHHRPDEGLGRSRGGLTCKIHIAGEGGCRPLAFLVTPGQWGDAPQMIEVLERIRVPRPQGGRPRTRPDHLGGDKAYSSRRNRRYLRRRQIKHTIPSRRTSGPTANGAAARAVGPPASTARSTNVATRSSGRSTGSRPSGPSPPATTRGPSSSTAPWPSPRSAYGSGPDRSTGTRPYQG